MEILGIPVHVVVIQSRLDLIEQAERRRFQVLDREQQGDRSQSFLPAGELHHILQLLSGRLCDDPYPRFQDILILHQFESSLSAAEELAEHLVKLLRDPCELF